MPATYYKNTNYKVYNNTKDTFPASSTVAGTASSSGTSIVGSGTTFTTIFKPGDWLYHPASSEIRKITAVVDNLHMTVDHAFTTPLAGATVKKTPNSEFCEISCGILTGSATGAVDDQPLYSGSTACFVRAGHNNTGQRGLVDPIVIDATGTIVSIVAIR